jgi:hypothetical protein
MGLSPTLLLGTSGPQWHAWRESNLKGRDLVLLDPADAHFGPAARLRLMRGDKLVESFFFGSLDAQRAPHQIVAACSQLLAKANPKPIVQLFAYRPSPIMRQTAQLLAFMVEPEAILIAAGTPIDLEGWPIGPETIELPVGLPEVVVHAQRKAQWLKMIEQGERHEVILAKASVQGSRLGSGAPLAELALQQAGLEDVLHAETCGSTLFIVSEADLDEDRMSRALDMTHTHRAQIVHPADYQNLLCAFLRTSGEAFGYGRVENIDFAAGVAILQADAVAPVPIPILRLGTLKVNADGRELGEAKPWSL